MKSKIESGYLNNPGIFQMWKATYRGAMTATGARLGVTTNLQNLQKKRIRKTTNLGMTTETIKKKKKVMKMIEESSRDCNMNYLRLRNCPRLSLLRHSLLKIQKQNFKTDALKDDLDDVAVV